jgi:hypothetical protein
MILQQRLTSRSSRSLAVMIGFAQPAGSRGTWRSDGNIEGGGTFRSSLLPPLLLPSFSAFPAATAREHSTRFAPGCPGLGCETALNRQENRHG